MVEVSETVPETEGRGGVVVQGFSCTKSRGRPWHQL